MRVVRVPALAELFRPDELVFLLFAPAPALPDDFLAEEEPRVAMMST
jgi:hypothetical protein